VSIEGEHFPTEVGYHTELQSGQDPGEDNKHADELPLDGLSQFVQKFFDCANPKFYQLSRWLFSDNPPGGGPGLAWLHVVCVSGWFDILPSSLKQAYLREINITIIWQKL
jgi:hypothetical protein